MVLNADEAFAKVEHRRPDFGGRVFAVHAQRAAHQAIANFLLELERTDPPPLRTTPNRPGQDPQQMVGPAKQPLEEARSGQKRPGSPTLAEDSPRSPKRRHSKRVSFDASVVVRDDSEIRDTDAFQRNSESYFPGRNAPPQDTEFLDTSGWSLDFKDFHRLQWIGHKWIPRLEPDEEKLDDNKVEDASDQQSGEAAKGREGETKGETSVETSSEDRSITSNALSKEQGQLGVLKDETKANFTGSELSYDIAATGKEESAVEVGETAFKAERQAGLSTSGDWSSEVAERPAGAGERETGAGTVESTIN
jgi:hypothetical protein